MAEIVEEFIGTGVISRDDVSSGEPNMIIGIPALSVFDILCANAHHDKYILGEANAIYCKTGKEITDKTCPADNISRLFWPKLKKLMKEMEIYKIRELGVEELEKIRRALITQNQNPEDGGVALSSFHNQLVAKFNSLSIDLTRVNLVMGSLRNVLQEQREAYPSTAPSSVNAQVGEDYPSPSMDVSATFSGDIV